MCVFVVVVVFFIVVVLQFIHVYSYYQWQRERTNGLVAQMRLFVLGKLNVTFLKNEIYGYGHRYSLNNSCHRTGKFA